MNSTDDEVEILEKVANHRRKIGAHAGILTLTNKRLIFQPDRKYSVITTLYFAAVCLFFGIAGFVGSAATFFIPGAPSFFLPLSMSIGILATVPGVALVVVACLRRNSKEVVMELKTIKYVSETGRSDIVIKLEGDRKERFYMQRRAEFLDEVKFAIGGDPMTVPSSLVVTEDVNAPKYSVPSKYPGAVVRLQKTYSTPKICCMCGEPTQEKTVTAKSVTRERTKQGVPYFSPLSRIRTPFTHLFPICADCFRVHRRAKIAGSLGGIIGLFVGGAVFALLFFSGLLTPILAVIAGLAGFITGLSNITTNLFFFALFVLVAAFFGGVGWMTAHSLARDAIATRQVPKERKSFFKVIAEDKGIRIIRRPGFVAFGFLSKEFAAVFNQMNGGVATAVDASDEEKKKIRRH